MPNSFLWSLTLVVVALLGARLLLALLPLRSVARPLPLPDMGLVVVGALGLVLHCAAMFYPSAVEALPGTEGVIIDIQAMGTASIVWFVVPGILVVVGLMRQHPVAPGVVALALAAVGVTMYGGSTLSVHLASIFFFTVALAAVASALVERLGRHTSSQPG